MVSAYKMAHHLSRVIQVVVLTTGSPKYEEINENLKIYRMRDLFFSDPINYSVVPNLYYNLLKVMRKEKPDVYLVNKHMFFTSFSIILLRMLGKKVITVTDTFPGINWQPRKKIVGIFMKAYAYVIGLPLLKISNIVVLLHEGLIPVAKRLKLKYTVVHNGVDLAKYDNPSLPSDIPKVDDEIIITYVGRLESVKGYDDLLSVAEDLLGETHNIKFLFVGNTDGKDNIINKHANKKIQFLGHRNDIPSILKFTDVFVLPSYSEGLPNALMEAMASRVACIASNVGGIKVLIENENNGLLFQPGNKEELKMQILTLVNSRELRQKYGESAKQTIDAKYDWAKISSQYIELFKQYINT